ncbi:efflux RND transporter periplasmic adaptor subunit [Arhodomonas sp. SL1]|uniref:efflux RND transporter periplasmic adaptor subunit n=1 Tax=Arhodomonas sp. SL1 TaxID=3425691 RepID=UPI003F882D7E
MGRRRNGIAAAAAMAIIGALIWALWPAPVPVNVALVERGPFAEYVEDEGRAWLPEPHVVTAPIGGYLRRVDLDPGDRVTAGQVLFELEALPSPALDARSREQARDTVSAARARLAMAEAGLEAQRARREVAEGEYQRHRQLHAREFISAEVMDRIRAERDAAMAGERAARHAVEVARFELAAAEATLAVADGERAAPEQPSLPVRAAIEGTVVERFRCCEGPIAAGAPVLEIGDLSTLEVRFELLSPDAVRVRPGMSVVLERWGGDAVLDGEVLRVEPRGVEEVSALGVEERRVPVRVAIRSPKEAWEGLGDGYRVEGRFILWQGDDVLQVPTSALFREGDRWMAFVAEDGRARLRPVERGRQSGLRTQVLGGLSHGERVITHPGDRLSEGIRVRLQE